MNDLTSTKSKVTKLGYCKYCDKPTGKSFRSTGNVCFGCKIAHQRSNANRWWKNRTYQHLKIDKNTVSAI